MDKDNQSKSLEDLERELDEQLTQILQLEAEIPKMRTALIDTHTAIYILRRNNSRT